VKDRIFNRVLAFKESRDWEPLRLDLHSDVEEIDGGEIWIGTSASEIFRAKI